MKIAGKDLIFTNLKEAAQTNDFPRIKALSVMTPFFEKGITELLMNAFFQSQFSYCPLSRVHLGYETNRSHKRCLGIIQSDNVFSLNKLFEGTLVSVPYRNMQALSIELF